MTTITQADPIRTENPDLGSLPVGVALRTRREQLGWLLPDVAAWLRIKLSYLEALESGQVAKLPGNAYAFGFLRAYAGALGLDVDNIAERFRREAKDINRKPELAFPAPVPERGVPAGAVVLLGVLVVIGAYVGWYEFTGHERAASHMIPAVPEALAPLAGGSAPSPQVATVMPGPGQVPSPLPAPSVPPGSAASPVTAPSGSGEASAGASTAPPSQAALTATQTTASAGPAAAPAAPATTAPAPLPAATGPAGQMVLNASASTWVQVRQPGGKVIYDHVLQAGDSWPVPPDSGAVTLTTGNAGGLTLSADGVTTPPLGRNGAVRRNLPLSVDAIRDGSLTSDAKPAASASAPASPLPSPVTAAGPNASAVDIPDAPKPAAPMPAVPRTLHHVRPPASPSHAESSADELNARQLQSRTPD